MKHSNKIIAFILFAGLVAIGCNTTRKHKSKTRETVDSTKVAKIDSSKVTKLDSTGTTKKDSSAVSEEDTGTEVEITYGDDTSVGPTIIIFDEDTVKTEGKRPTKVNWKKKGTRKDSTGVSTTTTGKVNRSDSSHVSRNDSAYLKKDVKGTVSDKKSSRFPWTIVGGVVLLILAFGIIFWVFGPPRKRKEK